MSEHDQVREAIEQGASADELATLGEGVDGDLAVELTQRMLELAAVNRRTGDRYALRLGAMASGMSPDLGAAVHVEVELLRGAIAFDNGLLSRAAHHAQGLLDRFDERADPSAVGGAEALLGAVARERRRFDEAIGHWDRSRRLAVAAQDWGTAATAAASSATAAREADRPGVELWRRWTDAAELTERAGDLEDARVCGTNSSVYAVMVLNTPPDPDEWDAARLRDAALEARAFALRHGARHEAAHLAVLVAVAVSDLAAFDEVHAWAQTARREYGELDQDPADVEGWLACVDFAEGNAALLASDVVRAEPLLRQALTVFDRLGDEHRARPCRLQLLAIAYAGEVGGERARERFQQEQLPDADAAAVAATMAEHLAQREGRDDDAERLHTRTMALLAAAGEPIKALAHDLGYAAWRVTRGDVVPAIRALSAAEACLATPPPGESRAILVSLGTQRSLLRVALADARGDHGAAISELGRLELDLLGAGSSTLAAQTAVERGRQLRKAGRPDEALDVALPAALALDAIRFTFADAGRRKRWGVIAASGFDVAFRAAVDAGRWRVLAELIEVARGAGVPTAVESPPTGIEALLAETPRDLHLAAADAAALGPAPSAVPGAAAIGHPDRTSLGLPARLRTPWGTVALAEALQDGRRYLDPVRADTVIEWTVGFATFTGVTGPAR